MRVIAGTARRIQLKTTEGLDTRPTTDRIKETLFNMISPHLSDAVFLDLFSGCGGIGIEALSRGAKEAVFVENNRAALECIKDNLFRTKLEDKSLVMAMDVFQALVHLESSKKVFDFVFMDPPYSKELEKQVLEFLQKTTIIHKNTLIIFEAALQTNLEYIETMNVKVDKIKKYKTNMHVFCYRI